MRVVKVGGSLFAFNRMVSCLREWLDQQAAAMNVFISGGGALVDCLRHASERFDLPEPSAHWMCVDLMSVTARMLHELLPESELVTEYDSLPTFTQSSAGTAFIIFDARQFLLEVEPQLPGIRLPQSWAVTSDSIAARVAEAIGAQELVLLKSANVTEVDLFDAANAGLVDDHFSIAAQTIRNVRVVNLRATGFPETRPISSVRVPSADREMQRS